MSNLSLFLPCCADLTNTNALLQQSTPFPFSEVIKPKYWLTWVGLAILRLIILLPYPAQTALGRRIGRLSQRLSAKRRRIAQINIQRCFPNLSAEQHQQVLDEHFDELGMMLLDTGLSWWAKPKTLQKLATIKGMEHLDAALKRGKGVILLTGHMTSLDIGGIILSQALSNTKHPMQVMYKRNRNILLETIIRRGRERFMYRLFVRQDMRSFIRGLKENLPTWYAPDQDFGRKNTVFADFFGIATSTLPTTGKIAHKTDAAVVPYFPIRLPDNQGFEIRILPMLEDFPTSDEIADATTVNKVLEDMVRKFPAQYLWVHRRFKTRPEGEPPFYS